MFPAIQSLVQGPVSGFFVSLTVNALVVGLEVLSRIPVAALLLLEEDVPKEDLLLSRHFVQKDFALLRRCCGRVDLGRYVGPAPVSVG